MTKNFKIIIVSFVLFLSQSTKKRMKFLPIVKIAGSVTDGRQISWTFININTAPFFEIHRDNYSRIMWLDPGLTLWEGAHSRNLINSLETRHN